MIVAIGGQKGGAGKTTTTVSIGAEWLRAGLRVLFVDTDPQRSLATWGEVAGEAAAVSGGPVPTVVSLGAGLHRQLPELAKPYDRVLIDCPPRLDAVQRSALLAADLLLVPTGPSAVDAWALTAAIDVVAEAKALRPELEAVVLLTRVRRSTVLGRQARGAVEASGLTVLQAQLGDRVTYPEAIGAGLGPTTYAPSSTAADEVRALVRELDRLRLAEET